MSEIIKSNDYDERDFFKEQINDCVETVMSEDFESPNCEVCGHCGKIGCCGIRNFISEHIEGKTNCKNEGIIINELINLCDYKDEVFDENKKLKSQLQQKDNIIKDLKAQLDYLETYSSKEDVFEDIKRRLDRIEKIIGENNDK